MRRRPIPKGTEERNFYITLEPALWHLLEKTHRVVNVKLKAAGKKPISLRAVITLILRNALLENANDVQEEFDELGLHRLAVRLAPLFGAEGLASCGLPEVPDGTRPLMGRPSRFL